MFWEHPSTHDSEKYFSLTRPFCSLLDKFVLCARVVCHSPGRSVHLHLCRLSHVSDTTNALFQLLQSLLFMCEICYYVGNQFGAVGNVLSFKKFSKLSCVSYLVPLRGQQCPMPDRDTRLVHKTRETDECICFLRGGSRNRGDGYGTC